MHESRRVPQHHVDLAVAFADPCCLVIAGWAERSAAWTELELLCTASGWDARSLRCEWFPRPDVDQLVPSGAGFCTLIGVDPAELDGPFHLAFRSSTGARLLGNPVEPVRYRSELRDQLKGLFAAHRRLVPAGLVLDERRRMELLQVAAAPPRDFSETAALWIDGAIRLPDGSWVVAGWCYAEHGFRSLELLDGAGRAACDLLSTAVFYPRPDVRAKLAGRRGSTGNLGFVVRAAEPAGADWTLLCARTHQGELYGVELPAPAYERMEDVPQRLISLMPPGHEEAFLDRCLGPALISLAQWSSSSEPIWKQRTYGSPPPHAAISIVVVAEHGPDWLRYQLSALADLAELERAELIYVLRLPEAESDFRRAADDLHTHFNVPFQLLCPTEPLSMAAAVNAATLAARGEHSLLLDGRILPRGPFLHALRDAFTAAGDAAGVGPRLVNANGLLELPPLLPLAGGLQRTALPESLLDLAGPIAVDALSTACLLLERRHFLDVGGLAPEYYSPTVASLDLCLRLQQGGRRLYFVPEVSVDDLRAAPPPGDPLLRKLDDYDRWLFDRRVQT